MADIELLQVDHIDWPNAVISAALATPPGSPTAGDRYIVAASPTGAWAGHATHVARWDGAAWGFQTPAAGRIAFNEATTTHLKFDGAAWVSFTGSATMQLAYDGGATVALTSTDIVITDASLEVLRLGSATKLAAPTMPTTNTAGYDTTITGSTGGAAAAAGFPGDGGKITITAGAMGSETAAPGGVVGGVAGNNLVLKAGGGGNTSGLKTGSTFIDGGTVGTGAAGGTPLPGNVVIGSGANDTRQVIIGQSTSGTPVVINGPVITAQRTVTFGTTSTVNLALGSAHKLTLTGNATLTFSFPNSYSNDALNVAGLSGTVTVVQDATGSRTLAFASLVKTQGDVTVNSAANAITVYSFVCESVSVVRFWKSEASAAASGVTSFNSRTGAVTPQTGDYTATNVGLGSVTNDSQLKRAASDFSSFTTKATPVAADVILIEDSAASGAKKSATLSSLATAIGAGGSAIHDPFLDPPTSANGDDDEFTSDTILGGSWTIEDSSNSALTRSGGVDPWTLPSAGNYRSTQIGSVLLIQTPANVDVRIHKTITSIGTNEFIHGRFGFACNSNSTPSNDMLLYFGVCANSAGHTDLNNAAYMASLSPGGAGQLIRSSSVVTSTATTVDSAQLVQSQESQTIWGIRKATANYYFLTSDGTGQTQRYQGPIANSATMARFFFRVLMQTNGIMPGCVALHFIRRQSSATAWFAQA